jgi:hypothetical protein
VLVAEGRTPELDRDGGACDGVGGRPGLADAASSAALGQGVTVTENRVRGGAHGFSTASMTARAIGAATLPP